MEQVRGRVQPIVGTNNMEDIIDLTSRGRRLKGYRSGLLTIAKGIIYISVGVMSLVYITTLIYNQQTANLEYKAAHAFKPIH